MPQILTENDAMDALKLKVAYTVDPTLDEANELLPILRRSARATIWIPATAYAVGDVVQPTAINANGHRFVLIGHDSNGLLSGASEPNWPVWDNGTVSDGNLTWRETGPAYSCLWDIDKLAPYLAWDMKVQKASACGVDFSTQSIKVSQSQLVANLERTRDRFLPINV